MARYLVLEPSFIGNHLVPAGAEVDYDGEPGTNLRALDALVEEAPAKVRKPKAGDADALV